MSPCTAETRKMLILSSRVRKNAAEQQLGQLVSCQVTLHNSDRKTVNPVQAETGKTVNPV
jgi:hypothetical protein